MLYPDVEVDLSQGSVALLVVFGGLAAGFGIPPFEFMRMTSELPVGKVFVRDVQQAWYQRGVPEIGPRPADIARYLQSLIDREKPSRVVFAGNSAGGFAALLFGKLLGADMVLAFAPQTFIAWPLRVLHRDFRWNRELLRLLAAPHERRYLDLRPFLARPPIHHELHVYYGGNHRLDALHAERVASAGVTLHRSPAGGHNLVKHLRDSGELEEILRVALSVT